MQIAPTAEQFFSALNSSMVRERAAFIRLVAAGGLRLKTGKRAQQTTNNYVAGSMRRQKLRGKSRGVRLGATPLMWRS